MEVGAVIPKIRSKDWKKKKLENLTSARVTRDFRDEVYSFDATFTVAESKSMTLHVDSMWWLCWQSGQGKQFSLFTPLD